MKMQFSTIFISATLAALSAAQGTSSTIPSTVSTSLVSTTTTFALTPAQSTQAACLQACPADDPTCRTKCIVVDDSIFAPQNRTIECIAGCDRGNGTAAENLAFEECNRACIATASILPTTSAISGSSTRGAAATGSGTAAAGGSGTATGTGARPSATGNAGSTVQVGVLGALVSLGGLAVVFGL